MKFFIDTPILIEAYHHILQVLQPVKHYPYHNIWHTLDVFHRTREVANSEWIAQKDQVSLLLAALFHDVGFIENYSKNEIIGMRIVRAWLEQKNYPEKEIKNVERLIEVTIPFSETKNLQEQIIQDADLDNFGRDDCFEKMYLVEKELTLMTSLDIKTIYNIFQKLHTYNFQTPTALRDRQPKKLKNRLAFEQIYKDKFGF